MPLEHSIELQVTPDFRTEFLRKLREHGIDPETTSVASVMQHLRISDRGDKRVDRESMRQVLRTENYQPSERIKAILTSAISNLNIMPSGEHTRKLIEPLLKDGRPYFAVGDRGNTENDADIFVKMVLVPNHRHLIRCADDQPKSGPPSDAIDYLNQHVKILSSGIDSHDFDSATLITTLSSDLCAQAEQNSNIEVINRSDFLLRFFDRGNCRRELAALAQDIGIVLDDGLRDSSLELRFQDQHEKPYSELELFEQLSDDHFKEKQSFVAFVSGTSGTGKTGLCYRLAWRLLYRPEDSCDFSTPIIVSGRQLTSHEDLIAAIRQSVDRFYRFSADEHLVRELIREGRLIVFVDSLNEIPDFNSYSAVTGFLNLPGVDSDTGRYLLTFRPEVLPREDFQEFCAEAKAHPDSSSLLLLLNIQPFAEVHEMLKRNDALGPWLAAKLASDSILANPLHNLCRIPFFFRMITSSEGKATLTELLRLTPASATERSRILYILVKEMAGKWIGQILQGINEPRQTLFERRRDLYDFCELVCGIFFQYSEPDGCDRAPSINMTELLGIVEQEEIGQEGHRPHEERRPYQAEERRLYLNRLVKASTFVERDQDGECHLVLPDNILHDFFLAEFLMGALLSRRDNERSDEDRLRFWGRLARSPLSNRHKLLPLLVAGALQSDYQKESVIGLLERIRTDHALLDFAATAEGRYLIQNVIFIVTAAVALSESKSVIDLSDLSLAGCDFKPLSDVLESALSIKGPEIKISKANCEFVRWAKLQPSINLSRRGLLSRGQWTDEPVSTAEESDDEVCKFTECCADLDSTQWSLVPGNVFTVSRYEGNSEDPGSSEPRGIQRILVGSFWIQHHPVSNWDFLSFLMDGRHRQWRPESQRTHSKNDYYLRGWDPVLQGKLAEPWTREWSKSIESNLVEWCKAPVVYVSWSAAKAYAKAVGGDLPTEAEFEVAARYFQCPQHGAQLLERDRKFRVEDKDRVVRYSDYPWGWEVENYATVFECLDGYALFATLEGQERRQLIPYDDLSNEKDPRIENWRSWALRKREMHPEKISPVPHLVGGIRHWMADVWRPSWPPQRDLKKSGFGDVIFAPFQDGWSGNDGSSPTSRRFVSDWRGYRTLRGGSLHLPASQNRISYRAAQRETNINPDVGFRCVKRLWPKKLKPQNS
ncbi:MAG TPA: SUMF1/EgtB/PvdO family nonheme iron enzyme [Terracidiphilus sp.]|nr:SUMF1/EgtB/PvdO family nonheme iron enzyme [Terracidiphilus sp.]